MHQVPDSCVQYDIFHWIFSDIWKARCVIDIVIIQSAGCLQITCWYDILLSVCLFKKWTKRNEEIYKMEIR